MPVCRFIVGKDFFIIFWMFCTYNYMILLARKLLVKLDIVRKICFVWLN